MVILWVIPSPPGVTKWSQGKQKVIGNYCLEGGHEVFWKKKLEVIEERNELHRMPAIVIISVKTKILYL